MIKLNIIVCSVKKNKSSRERVRHEFFFYWKKLLFFFFYLGVIYNVVSLVGSFPFVFFFMSHEKDSTEDINKSTINRITSPRLELGPCTKGYALETSSTKYTFVSIYVVRWSIYTVFIILTYI